MAHNERRSGEDDQIDTIASQNRHKARLQGKAAQNMQVLPARIPRTGMAFSSRHPLPSVGNEADRIGTAGVRIMTQ